MYLVYRDRSQQSGVRMNSDRKSGVSRQKTFSTRGLSWIADVTDGDRP